MHPYLRRRNRLCSWTKHLGVQCEERRVAAQCFLYLPTALCARYEMIGHWKQFLGGELLLAVVFNLIFGKMLGQVLVPSHSLGTRCSWTHKLFKSVGYYRGLRQILSSAASNVRVLIYVS